MNIQELHEVEEVTISGYGSLPLETAKRSAIDKVTQALNYIRQHPEDPIAWSNAQHILYGSGVVQAFMNAIVNSAEVKE